MSNSQTIRDLYDAFQRGDLPAILAVVTDDVDWNNQRVASRECPWNGDFSGKAKLPGFFQAVGDNLDIRVFDPHTFIENGERVAVLLRIESVLRRNGKPLSNDAVHVWDLSDGKVSRYRHYNDTAAELEAWRA
ncbi:MAG TPA: nuclear transport factor 2 family protein [Thermoanaerobaculia bacterium]|jgi:hypothetical protein|nr:nuclear transport factor 2 family protein [Thermoanaerobaculia bacterium]